MLYRRVPETLRRMNSLKSHIHKVRVLTGLFREAKPTELPCLISLLSRQFFFPWDTKRFRLGIYHLSKAVTEISVANLVMRELQVSKELIHLFIKDFNKLKKQTSLIGEQPLSITEVCSHLKKILELKGKGSLRQKKSFLQALFLRASKEEVENLVKIIFQQPISIKQEELMLSALSNFFSMPLSTIKELYFYNPHFKKLTEALILLKNSEMKGVLGITLFKPLKPMNMVTVKEINEVTKKISNPAFLNFLKGLEVQIHCLKNKEINFKIYTHNLVDFSNRLKKIKEILPAINHKNFILEAELLSNGKHPLRRKNQPSKELASKISNKSVSKIEIQLLLVDILFLDGLNLAKEPGDIRLSTLQRLKVKEGYGIIKPTVYSLQEFKKMDIGFGDYLVKDKNAPYYLSNKLLIRGKRGNC